MLIKRLKMTKHIKKSQWISSFFMDFDHFRSFAIDFDHFKYIQTFLSNVKMVLIKYGFVLLEFVKAMWTPAKDLSNFSIKI